MIISRLSVILIAVSLLFTSCKDIGAGPDLGEDEEDDETELKASINSPDEGAELDGQITMTIDGESDDGFKELRIFVGDNKVKTVTEPELPYEHAITTYKFDNGTYDLKAELEPSDEDTTLSPTVSTTFENYMVELETDGYIDFLNQNYEASYLFIADPAGNVLREVELTSHIDGVFKLLPPSQLADGAPKHFSITIGNKTTDFQGNDAFYISTDVGLKSWSKIYKSGPASGSGSTSATDLQVEMTNFEQEPWYTYFALEDYPNYSLVRETHQGSDLSRTVEIPGGSEHLVITHTPDAGSVQNPVPVYKWEQDPTELQSPVSYNVTEDFTKMVSHTVSNTSNIDVRFYNLWMTVAPNSFEKGDMYFYAANSSVLGDANGSDSGFGIWVPQITEQSFITYMNAVDQSNPNIIHSFQSPVMQGFPDQFKTVDGKVTINNPSLDDLELDITGSPDYVSISADASTDSYTQSWRIVLPDTTNSYVFPKIADSLDQSVNNYNRSDFQLSSVLMSDAGKIDDYSGYIDWMYGAEEIQIIEFYDKTRRLNSSSKKRVPVAVPHSSNSAIGSSPHSLKHGYVPQRD